MVSVHSGEAGQRVGDDSGLCLRGGGGRFGCNGCLLGLNLLQNGGDDGQRVELRQTQQHIERVKAGGELHADLAHGAASVFIQYRQLVPHGQQPAPQQYQQQRCNDERIHSGHLHFCRF